jgi:hypothetical protein
MKFDYLGREGNVFIDTPGLALGNLICDSNLKTRGVYGQETGLDW